MMKALPEGFSAEERAARGRDLFLEGYNCCQSVLLAFEDVLPVDGALLKTMGSGFGGGVARLREVCGCVSAMAMIAGFISPAQNPGNMDERTANYALVQQLAEAYKTEMGSVVCREILGLRAAAKEAPRPSERTPEYYKSRPCARSCEVAARIVAEYLIACSGRED